LVWPLPSPKGARSARPAISATSGATPGRHSAGAFADLGHDQGKARPGHRLLKGRDLRREQTFGILEVEKGHLPLFGRDGFDQGRQPGTEFGKRHCLAAQADADGIAGGAFGCARHLGRDAEKGLAGVAAQGLRSGDEA
jgi:hypothetical protein